MSARPRRSGSRRADEARVQRGRPSGSASATGPGCQGGRRSTDRGCRCRRPSCGREALAALLIEHVVHTVHDAPASVGWVPEGLPLRSHQSTSLSPEHPQRASDAAIVARFRPGNIRRTTDFVPLSAVCSRPWGRQSWGGRRSWRSAGGWWTTCVGNAVARPSSRGWRASASPVSWRRGSRPPTQPASKRSSERPATLPGAYRGA